MQIDCLRNARHFCLRADKADRGVVITMYSYFKIETLDSFEFLRGSGLELFRSDYAMEFGF